MAPCDTCGEPADDLTDGLCPVCDLLYRAMAWPSYRTLDQMFQKGVEHGKEMYAAYGARIMRGRENIQLGRVDIPGLEPIDTDAMLRGAKEGILRAHRLVSGLPETCEETGCGIAGICDFCRMRRGQTSP